MKRSILPFVLMGMVAGIGLMAKETEVGGRGTANSIYARPVFGVWVCIAVSGAPGSICNNVSTTSGGAQATIISNGGGVYLLFEDSGCSRAIFFDS